MEAPGPLGKGSKREGGIVSPAVLLYWDEDADGATIRLKVLPRNPQEISCRQIFYPSKIVVLQMPSGGDFITAYSHSLSENGVLAHDKS